MKGRLIVFIAAAILSLTLAYSSNGLCVERFDVIYTDRLVQLLDKRENGELDFVLVNTLDELIYRYKSIPGSVNMPMKHLSKAPDLLGNNKDRLIITYCLGER